MRGVNKTGKTLTAQVNIVPGFNVNITDRWRKNLPPTKEAKILFDSFIYILSKPLSSKFHLCAKNKCCSFDDNSWLPNLLLPEYLPSLQFKNWMSFSLISFS